MTEEIKDQGQNPGQKDQSLKPGQSGQQQGQQPQKQEDASKKNPTQDGNQEQMTTNRRRSRAANAGLPRTFVHSEVRAFWTVGAIILLLEDLRQSLHSVEDIRALTAEAAQWNHDVFVRLTRAIAIFRQRRTSFAMFSRQDMYLRN